MNATQMKTILAKCISTKQPVLIKGAPGIGKSDVVTQATQIADANLLIMHPVVSDPTDFQGLPGFLNGKAEFLPYGNLREMIEADKLTVVFLDDLGQAPPSVQAACMQLLLAREINGKKISEHVTFIAATNRREDRAGVSGMLEPVKSRFTTILELDVDVEEWISWALDAQLPAALISFVKFRPALLHDFKPSSDMVNSPCPRTVANCGKLMALDLPEALEYEAYKGAVGEGFATELMGFLKILRNAVHPDVILMNPTTCEVPTDPSVLYAICGALARKASDTSITRIIQFADRIPTEFAVLLVKECIRTDQNVVNSDACIRWFSKNDKVLI